MARRCTTIICYSRTPTPGCSISLLDEPAPVLVLFVFLACLEPSCCDNGARSSRQYADYSQHRRRHRVHVICTTSTRRVCLLGSDKHLQQGCSYLSSLTDFDEDCCTAPSRSSSYKRQLPHLKYQMGRLEAHIGRVLARKEGTAAQQACLGPWHALSSSAALQGKHACLGPWHAPCRSAAV